MPDSTNPVLDSVVSIANASIKPKILTPDNFEVLSVRPFKESTSNHNTLVTVKIDLGASAALIALSESDRYSVRPVKITRIDLADVAQYREIEKNELGQYQIDAASLGEVISVLNINALEEEFEEIIVNEETGVSIIRALPNSLGWKGQITIVRETGILPWVCSGDVTRVAGIRDSGVATLNRQYKLRVKIGSDSWHTFTIGGTGRLSALVSANAQAVAYLNANSITISPDSGGTDDYFTNDSHTDGVQIEFVPLNDASKEKLAEVFEQTNTSIVGSEAGGIQFCLAQLPPLVAGLIITNTNLPTTDGDGEVQLTFSTVPDPAYTGGILTWTIIAGHQYATVSETGLLTIVDAPNGILIGVRLTSINGVTTTKNIPTADQSK
jgi:hypothetical protein